ncbi:2-C-methyl-D-erythritol 4-phosphate cytidylyltransferase [uncultured Bacteroides sp.]|uniref:2-C-methyl-D-erythritol 4-phosphate cytidylyltransferase n=1 Tax=uncultured Bacteroides sp. TaxID=162156 RepID=UPI002AAC282E|nr:2-C-methyl-D-erythritol 4-phosphate cytidylyltransferase [uncultured Bacteroides sp.]
MNKYVIIVAGGKGLRMGMDVPKQFLPLEGKLVLMHTIEAFYKYDVNLNIIVVLPLEQQEYWKEKCSEFNFFIKHQVVDGGEARFYSVKNALCLIPENAYVAVHDGVRPFVSQEVIARCYQEVVAQKAVIPVVDVVDTMRYVNGDVNKTVDRNAYKMVQTPQVFESNILLKAYKQDYVVSFTDDASVVESLGIPVFLTEGNRENIKITTPFDLKIAASLL